MEELFFAFLRAGIFGSVIIVLVLLLRLCLRKAPRQLICILWLLAAVRLVLPFTIESRLSLQPEMPTYSDVQVRPPVQTPNDAPVVTPVPPASQPSQNPPPVVAPAPQKAWTWEQILSAVWLTGAGALAIYGIVSYLLLKRRLRTAVKQENWWESDTARGAFVMGYLKPKIYLPAQVEAGDRPYIVAHEQAHIARGDHWWKLLGFVCLCLHWYNPLVWLSFVLFGRDTEVACDERVVWGMALEERKAYSLALLNCGKRVSGLTAVTLCFGKESLKQRIKNVLSYRKPGFWITAVAGMLAVAIAIFFLTSPKSQDPDPTDPTDGTTAPTTQMPTDGTTVPPTTQTPTTAPTDPTTVPPTTVPPTTVPPTTAPPETVPPTTAPPVTQPPVTEPPITEPPVTEPPVTEPPVTEPPVTEPPVTEPPVTEPPVVYSGACGENVQWTLTGGLLTISGSGDITSSPWLEYRADIFEIIIREGVTSIPDGAFADCTKLCYVTVEPGLTYVGTGAFTGFESILMYWHGSAPEFAQKWKSENYAFIHYPEGDETWPEARKHNYVTNTEYRPVSYALSGFCGDNLAYYIDGTVMTICGTGAMDNYSSRKQEPWLAYKHFITKLIIEDGITSIGFNAFSRFDSITEVVIPGSVKTIGDDAFYYCTNLRSVTLPEGLERIESLAFEDCSSLTEITIPSSVTWIDSCAFGNCASLRKVVAMGGGVWANNPFSNSTGICELYFYGDPPEYYGNGLEVNAKAYYPAGNENWTEEVRKGFGEGITWIAM